MNDKSVVPEFIASLIDRKRQALEEEQRQKEEAEKRAVEEAQKQGAEKYDAWLGEAVLKAPKWLHPYLDLTIGEQPDFLRIAAGWDRVENLSLYFSIPGLAKIEFNPKRSEWRCEGVGWNSEYDNPKPYIRFNSSCSRESDLELILDRAQRQLEKYQELMQQYAAQQEESAKRAEEYARQEAAQEGREHEAQIQYELKQAQEKAEEQALFDAIKHDSIAIHMLKAFALLRDERSTFEQQIYEMDETMYSIENRWSRRAEELRRQADDAQRRADDERSRLQSDLEDAEAKLVKEQRKNNGW